MLPGGIQEPRPPSFVSSASEEIDDNASSLPEIFNISCNAVALRGFVAATSATSARWGSKIDLQIELSSVKPRESMPSMVLGSKEGSPWTVTRPTTRVGVEPLALRKP